MPKSNKIRCLLIDDDQAAFLLTQALMEQIPWAQFELDWLPTREEGELAVARQEHDVYLVDYRLGDESGIDLVRRARAKGIRAPMILLTGKGRYEVDVEAMEAGLLDYLDKTRVDPDLLERSIRYAIDRVHQEEALRDSEFRHRSLFEHVPIGLYRTTLDGDLVDANPALLTILGHPGQDALEFEYARNFFVSPTQRQAFLDRLDQFGVVQGFESDLRRADGRTVRVRCAARAHRTDDGVTLYVEGAVEDLSGELETRAVRGRADNFQWIWEASDLAALVLNLDGSIREANPAFLQTFGFPQGQLTGRPLVELVDALHREGVTADLARLAAREPGTVARQLLVLTAAGGAWAGSARLGLVQDAKGNADHLLALFEDVSPT